MYKIILYTPYANNNDFTVHTLEHLQVRMLDNPDLGFGDWRYDGSASCFQSFTEYITSGSGSDATSILQFISSYCNTKLFDQELTVLQHEYTDVALGSKLLEQLHLSQNSSVNLTTYVSPTKNEIVSYHNQRYKNGAKAIINDNGDVVYFEGNNSPGRGPKLTSASQTSFIFEEVTFSVTSDNLYELKQRVVGTIASDYINILLTKQAHSAGIYHHFYSRFCYLGEKYGLYRPNYEWLTIDDSRRSIADKNIYKSGEFDRSREIGCMSVVSGQIIALQEIQSIVDIIHFEDIIKILQR